MLIFINICFSKIENISSIIISCINTYLFLEYLLFSYLLNIGFSKFLYISRWKQSSIRKDEYHYISHESIILL